MGNQSVFNTGNLLDASTDGALNGSPLALGGGATALSAPWSSSTAGIPTSTAAAAYQFVVSNVGAQPRDQVDSLVIADVTSLGRNGRLWSSQTATGLSNDGYGEL